MASQAVGAAAPAASTTAPAAGGTAAPAAVLTGRQVYDEMQDLLGRCSLSSTTKKLIRNYTRRIAMSQRQYVVATDLFPLPALRVYSLYNLGRHAELTIEEQTRYFSAQRGGAQGDYHDGMPEKIKNVVQCLHQYPVSKRAVITIPNTSFPDHTHDADAKCLRELHFYLDAETNASSSSTTTTPQFRLNATVWMRAQAAEIFPKNIHFIGALMTTIATALTAQSPPHPNQNTSKEEEEEAADHHKRDAEEDTKTNTDATTTTNAPTSTNEKHGGTMVVNVGELFYLATTLVSVRDD